MKDRVYKICETLSVACKHPETELVYQSHYTFLISVVLSAQSTDVQVNKVTEKLFKNFSTVDEILSLGLDGLIEQVKSIGLYKNKAKNIIAFSEIIKTKFDGKVPDNREDLESLPGVGRKSANVVLNTLFGKPVIAVDTHVLRLSNRLEFSQSTKPLIVEDDLEKIIPEKFKGDISNLLVLHGRYICKAKKPSCSQCVIKKYCNSSV